MVISKLNKKVLRDIRQNKMQFFNIFIMVFLGVFVFAGIHAYMDGMDVSASKYYESNNFEDLWLTGENFTTQDLEDVKKIENVKNAERQLIINTELENHKDVTLETIFIESNEIAKLYAVEGEEFQKGKKGVWLDSYLAKNLNLKVGDEISLKYKEYTITEKILGLVTSPDHVYFVKDDSAIFPTHKDYGFVYLSSNEFPIEGYEIFNQIIVDVDNTNKIEEGATYSSVLFTLLFLFIAILSVVTTMNRFVKKQRTQIGTLKALGFKNGKIIRHYVSYGFYISLIASILGIIAGRFILGGFFLNMEMSYFEIPVYSTIIIPEVYYLAVIVVVLITAVTYLSCRRILKEPAVESLRVEVPKVKSTKFDLTTKGIFKKSSISTRWNLRDIGRNKSRSIMAIVGIIGCTMLIVCAFGMLDTMNSYLNWEFDIINKFEYKISLANNYTDEELKSLEEKYENATSQSLGIELKIDDKKETNSIVVNDAKDYLKYTDHNKNYIDLKDDGVYITEKLAGKYNLKIGDSITWHIFGDDTWYISKIVGLNRDPQSQILNMTKTYYESLGLKYRADSIYTNSDLSDVKKLAGVDTIQNISNLRSGMESMMQTVKTMVVLLIVVSAILGFVIIYNLGILSFTEKQYQFATLKVLGFKNKQIKKIFIKQNLWLSIIGIIIGLPLGYFMIDYIFKSALGDNYDFSATIKWISYLCSTIGSLIVSLVVNKILSRKVNTIDMVSSLKGNE